MVQQHVCLDALHSYNILQSWEEADSMPRMEFVYDRILYARNLGYYKHKKMERAVRACHRLFGIKKPMYDQLYMLQVLPYGKLQKEYKDVVLDN